MTETLCFLSLAEASARIAVGTLTSTALTEAFLDRIARLNTVVNAFVRITADRARADARRADQEIAAGRYRGPLHGIPLAIKDCIDTAGITTTGHSRVLIDNVPTHDATTVARLAAAGAVLLGKTAMHEFAFGGPSFDLPFPPACNPWNPKHFTGGSSTGSAAAVGGGLCMAALGTDSGGSIRIPAGYCGVVGLKPTYGRISRAGVFPLSYSQDHIGPLTWTVEDCAIVTQVIAGADPRDPTCVSLPVPDYRAALGTSLADVRVGLVRHFYEEDERASEEAIAAMNSAAAVLESLGATVREVRLSSLLDYQATCMVILLGEACEIHGPWMASRPQAYGKSFREKLLLGGVLSPADYVAATRRRAELIDEVLRAHEQHDVLLTATVYGGAPVLQETSAYVIFQRSLLSTPFNVSGTPAISLCNGFTRNGLPLGMQVAGRPFDEAMVLRVAHAYERATPWRARRPNLQ